MQEEFGPKCKHLQSKNTETENSKTNNNRDTLALNLNQKLTLLPKFNPSFDYYSHEMGSSLSRMIIFSTNQVSRTSLVDHKLSATEIEKRFSEKIGLGEKGISKKKESKVQTNLSMKRSLNIDIGLLCLEQVLLSTSKPYCHRIYLKKGIFSDLTYIFRNKTFEVLPWTYPDYGCSEKIEYFNLMRKALLF